MESSGRSWSARRFDATKEQLAVVGAIHVDAAGVDHTLAGDGDAAALRIDRRRLGGVDDVVEPAAVERNVGDDSRADECRLFVAGDFEQVGSDGNVLFDGSNAERQVDVGRASDADFDLSVTGGKIRGRGGYLVSAGRQQHDPE